jgi:hypothetical protein
VLPMLFTVSQKHLAQKITVIDIWNICKYLTYQLKTLEVNRFRRIPKVKMEDMSMDKHGQTDDMARHLWRLVGLHQLRDAWHRNKTCLILRHIETMKHR